MKRIREPQDVVFRAMVRDLIKGLNALEPGQTRVTRNNARDRVKYAIRGLLRVLDSTYPRIALAPKPRRIRTLQERERELASKGFEESPGISVADLSKLTLAGVPIRRMRSPLGNGSPQVRIRIWVPTWARQLLHLPRAHIAEAARWPTARKVLLAEAALAKSGVP